MRTELIKIRDPIKKVFDRRSYYTKVEYAINNQSIVANMKIDTRACLKNHSRHLHAPLCAIFALNSVDVARYASFI